MTYVLPLQARPRCDTFANVESMVTDLDRGTASTTGAPKCNWE